MKYRVTVKHYADNSTDTYEIDMPDVRLAEADGRDKFPWADEVRAVSISVMDPRDLPLTAGNNYIGNIGATI